MGIPDTTEERKQRRKDEREVYEQNAHETAIKAMSEEEKVVEIERREKEKLEKENEIEKSEYDYYEYDADD
jgi:predicted GIY-YIG superfamily endonuclease